MPETEQQDKTLSEIVVKEAVGKGLDSPMRESILEAVEESDSSAQQRRLPLVGAVFGLGAALGFLVGQQSSDLEGSPLDSLNSLDEPEIIDDVTEQVEEATGSESEVLEETETESETEPAVDMDTESDGSSRLPKLLLAVGLVAGAVALRRRMGTETEEEWEPIEEFEPATTAEMDDEESEDDDEMDAEADADEAEAGADDDE
ncbi:hypothetical protein [Natronolimnobius baerhuensis]|uniref:Uncharacterized protein n=1 Tax=Natronolimnobius baerhuensis TaxID=253108 RepID=A0A202E4Z1_9EURY|nr:hypothetical protein [Natronolimnobius baerhuensis]OVE83289.1 hypothetical protein B2G88_17280 [Natronolimnobius baerhuensis]